MALFANSLRLSTVIDTDVDPEITCDNANAIFCPVSELSARQQAYDTAD